MARKPHGLVDPANMIPGACDPGSQNPVDGVGNCALDSNGMPIPTTPPTNSEPCSTSIVPGVPCAPNDLCTEWDLTESSDACYIDAYMQEQINISGATINVHKLLGVHEQTTIQDQTGFGSAISSGDLANFPKENAFNKLISAWHSLQQGVDVVANGYIGYDFGEIKLPNGRLRYGIETFVKKDVAMVKIKQGCDSNTRATKVRVERSSDGVTWYGVQVLNLQDCDGLVTYAFKRTVPSRWWRLRPLEFNGGANDSWVVQAVQLIDYEITQIGNIQDRLLLENRDRDYAETPESMKAVYQLVDNRLNATPWGFNPTDEMVFEVSFSAALASLGRPFVIGDIMEVPSETQYSPTLRPIKKYVEITDVAWSTNGYTPGWQPTLQRLIAVPAVVSQETQDLFGKLTRDTDDSGLADNDDGGNPFYQDFSTITDTHKADANTAVPERGTDMAGIAEVSQEMIDFGDEHPNLDMRKFARSRHVYGVDAMPPNGEAYTQGDSFPESPSDGDYHRLTYTEIRQGIPARLYRFSSIKGYWVYLETDRRAQYKDTNNVLEEFLDPEQSTVTNPYEVDEDTENGVS